MREKKVIREMDLFDAFGIDGNRRVFEDLVVLLKNRKAIGFVGAGASALLYPLWTGLIERLASQALAVDQAQLDFWRSQASKKAGSHRQADTQPIRSRLVSSDNFRPIRPSG